MAESFRRQSSGGTIGRIHHFKLVLLGETAVGKSSLVLRFVKDQFRDALESTVGGKPKSSMQSSSVCQLIAVQTVLCCLTNRFYFYRAALYAG